MNRKRRGSHPDIPAASSRGAGSQCFLMGSQERRPGRDHMGMTPELPVAMLACARIGAPHTVVFGGFSSNALVDRIQHSQAVAVITQEHGWPLRSGPGGRGR